MNNESIVNLTNKIIYQYIQTKGWKKAEEITLDLHEIYEAVLYPEYEYKFITSIDLGFLSDQKVLGKTISTKRDRAVLIDNSISPPKKDPRYPFTVGHEFAHSILHPKESQSFRCSSDKFLIKYPYDQDPDAGQIREFQANLFSENLIMPNDIVKAKFTLCFRPTTPFRYHGKGAYGFGIFGGYINKNVRSYTDFCIELAHPIRRFFGEVSVSSMALKIHKLGLVRNYTNEKFFEDPNNIGNVLHGMGF